MRIIEIIDRSNQGITRPFLCRAEDNAFYYVKGSYAGRRALCAEWCAGELGRRWGLPIAPFQILEVPSQLLRESARGDIDELGAGEVFGSQRVEGVDELRWSQVESKIIPQDLRVRLLFFDWWIANPDRMLSAIGGNPNLLWSSSAQTLHIIDHNLAFSPGQMSSSFSDFVADHVFGADLPVEEAEDLWWADRDVLTWVDDDPGHLPLESARSASFFTRIHNDLKQFWGQELNMLDEIFAALPETWMETVPDFSYNEVRDLLDRVYEPGFIRFGDSLEGS